MKLEDLDTIRDLAATREEKMTIRERLKSSSPRLLLGVGTAAVEFKMPLTLQKLVDGSVTETLDQEIAAATAKLRALGVDIQP